MSLALNSLILFFLLIFPGIIFRRFYYTSEFSKQFVLRDPFRSFVSNIVPGLVLQVFTIILFHSNIEPIDVDGLIEVLFHSDIDKHIEDLNKRKADTIKDGLVSLITYDSLYKFCKYLLFLLGISIGSAYLLKFIVRKFKLDIRYKLLRFQNEWHYLFKGEVKDFKSFKGKILNETHTTYIDVLTNAEDNKALFYTGLLTDYSLCLSTRKLEHLYLTNAKRYDKTKESGQKFQEIPGHILVIPYNKVKNINLRFQEVVREIDFKRRNNIFITISLLLSIINWAINPIYNLLASINSGYTFYEKLFTQIILILLLLIPIKTYSYTRKQKIALKNPKSKIIFYSVLVACFSLFMWLKGFSFAVLLSNLKGIIFLKFLIQFIIITAYTILYAVFIHNMKPENAKNHVRMHSYKQLFYFISAMTIICFIIGSFI